MTEDPMHFLLVEDDDDHATLVERTLSKGDLPLSLTRLSDGREAVEYLFEPGDFGGGRRPDVILLDLNLPLVTGHDILMRLKSDKKLRSIPVIVMTSSDADVDRNRAYAAHVNSYVVKPMNFANFKQLLEDIRQYWSVWNKRADAEGD